MNTIKIGGQTFVVGRNIRINGKTLISDGDIVGGAVIEEGVKIELHGTIDSLTCDEALVIEGSVGGDVHGKGPINCGAVGGAVSTNGPVNCGSVGGDVKASVVNCGRVNGNVTASVVNR